MGGQKPGFSAKYSITTLNIGEKPGFSVRSQQVLNFLQLPPIAILKAGLSEIRFM